MLIELFMVLLKLDPSMAEPMDMEKESAESLTLNDSGELVTGSDILRS